MRSAARRLHVHQIVLKGKNSDGTFATAPAKQYPPRFSELIAKGIITDISQGMQAKVIDWDEVNEQKHTSEVYLGDLPSDQVWPQIIHGKFYFPLAEGELNQPGLKATEMSRRQIKKDRLRKRKELEAGLRRFRCPLGPHS